MTVTTADPPREHPPASALEDLVSGAPAVAERALLEAHLHHCATCRARVAELSRVGGRFLESQRRPPGASDPASQGALDAVWRKLEPALLSDPEPDPLTDFPVPPASRDELRLREPLEWEELGPARVALLANDPRAETFLFLVETPAAAIFPHHRHVAGEDLVILQGGLLDERGHMSLGDFRHYPAGTEHAPLMDPDQRCMALAFIRGGLDFS